MSTLERKAREKEELKALILNASMKLFVEKGIEQTTIRNIADAIDYSVGTVYVYFKDKNAIFYALHTQCFRELGQQLRLLFTIKDPIERLNTLGRAYIQYATDNPDKYDLMFNLKAPMEFLNDMHQNEWDEGAASFDVLRTTVQESIEAGHFKGHNLEPLAYLIWGCIHGMCSLEIRGRTKGVRLKNPDTIVSDGYTEFLRLIENV